MAPTTNIAADKVDEEEEVKWDKLYKTKIIFDENNKPVPQWGFMKDNIEAKYEPIEIDSSHFFSWNFSLYLIHCALITVIVALTKLSLDYCSHPAQAFLLKSIVTTVIIYYLDSKAKAEEEAKKQKEMESTKKEPEKEPEKEPDVTEAEPIELSFTVTILRFQLLAVLQMIHIYTFSVLPLCVSQAISLLSPVISKLLGWYFKNSCECADAAFFLPLFYGVALCCKLPLLILGETYSYDQNVAIGLAVFCLLLKNAINLTKTYYRQNGLDSDKLLELSQYDNYIPITANFFIFLTSDALPQAFYNPPSYMLLIIVMAIGACRWISSYFTIPMSLIVHKKLSSEDTKKKNSPGAIGEELIQACKTLVQTTLLIILLLYVLQEDFIHVRYVLGLVTVFAVYFSKWHFRDSFKPNKNKKTKVVNEKSK